MEGRFLSLFIFLGYILAGIISYTSRYQAEKHSDFLA